MSANPLSGRTNLVPTKKLRQMLPRFSGRRMTVLGDMMLDHFVQGKVKRISPEAPVPVVTVSQETFVPGGAGNVANNMIPLGAAVTAASIVGADEAGFKLLSDLKGRGIGTETIISDPGRPTTQKTRVVAEHQQVVRFDRESTLPISAKLQEKLMSQLSQAIPESDALVISDYGKGVVTPQTLRFAIRTALKAKIPVIVDPKPEHFKRYANATCITPNLSEAFHGMRQLPREDDEAIEKLGTNILKTLKVDGVLITKGEKGMNLFQSHAAPSHIHIPTHVQEVFDVTGAGDTVVSVLALALASGATLLEASVLANMAAGIVVGKLGTATVSRQELEAALK